jgi:hypothetical protein
VTEQATARPTIADIKASLAPGERISEIRQDGTLVLRRPDFTVGSHPGALYITWPGNAVAMRKLAPSRVPAKQMGN